MPAVGTHRTKSKFFALSILFVRRQIFDPTQELMRPQLPFVSLANGTCNVAAARSRLMLRLQLGKLLRDRHDDYFRSPMPCANATGMTMGHAMPPRSAQPSAHPSESLRL